MVHNVSSSAAHSVEPERIVADFSSHTQRGLDLDEVEQRLQTHGPNTLPKQSGEGPLKVFLRQFHNPLVYVLLASAVLAVAMDKVTDAIVVVGVVLLNSIIGFVQEFKAGKALEALSAMVPERAQVLRAGERKEIDAQALVPGDIVFIQSGDKVPADMRLLEIKNLKVEEAALTGESVPVEKNLGLVSESAALGDRRNMAYGGTLVSYGTGKGIVVGTGAVTELGKISSMLKQTHSLETPLTRSLAKVGGMLTVGISGVAALLVLVGWWRGLGWDQALLAAITLAVAAIPEGLPAIVTITLAIGVRRMAAQKAVIRRLPAVETLGSTSTICSDKTGTLTKNEMTVQVLRSPQNIVRVSGVGYEPRGEAFLDDQRLRELPADLTHLLMAGALCNDSELRQKNSAWIIEGDPTEGALVVSYEKLVGSYRKVRETWARLDSFPFESENQFMATLHKGPENKNLLILKGAPEVVLKRCSFADSTYAHKIAEQIHQLAGEGLRVLAFAKMEISDTTISVISLEKNLSFIGIQAMIDPARPEAIQAIKDCHSAGIIVKMITGDHKETAQAIAGQLGIANQAGAITGEELSRISDKDLPALALRSNVFARVAPEHKLRLVRAIQSQGQVVAMTGDGVNDAPALKQANIGIAMGITGTSVSKEAAELVLTDDNFATIRTAVEEGRRVYDNLLKSLAFVLPTNLGEALIILLAVLFFPMVGSQVLMPILPVQILWINLVATVALAIPLAFEAKEIDVMKRKPRNINEPLFNSFVLWRTVIVASLMAAGAISLFFMEYQALLSHGIEQSEALKVAQTMAVTTVVFFQIFYLFNCRSIKNSVFSVGFFSNKSIFVGIFSLLALHAAFVYMPTLNSLFSSAPLSAVEWIKAIGMGAIVLPVVALEKAIRGKG